MTCKACQEARATQTAIYCKPCRKARKAARKQRARKAAEQVERAAAAFDLKRDCTRITDATLAAMGYEV